MSTLYLIALGAVAVAILAALLDAVIAVSRRETWTVRRPMLMVVHGTERRTQALPVAGRDRREGPGAATTHSGDLDRLSA